VGDGDVTRFLGIDAGGSKTRWEVVDAAARVLGSGESAGIQAVTAGPEQAAAALAAVISASGGPFEVAVVGIAGAGSPQMRARLRDALARAGVERPVAICGDPEVAAAAALRTSAGLAIWAGTGSFAIARDRAGQLVRTGGRGHLLGDEGGGYSIVRAAAVAAVKALDGVGPPTALGAVLDRSFASERPERLGVAMQACSPREVASRAGLVLEVAARGDLVARAVLEAEADSLAALGVSAAQRAGLACGDLDVALGGGLCAGSADYRDCLGRALAARGVLRAPRLADPAAHGAALLARAIGQREAPLARWVS
jgi:N-acetylglucosamine kinase-like BadF-type ATPase